MFHTRITPVIVALVLLGSGCWIPASNTLGLAVPKQNIPVSGEPALPCLAFEHRDGFAAWVDAYDAGTTDAVNLAAQIKLPKEADKKFISDVRASFTAPPGATPSFVCTLSDDGKSVVWVMEPVDADGNPVGDSTECHDNFYVSVNGLGTTSVMTAQGRTSDCRHLCKPKRWDPDLLVWQCDLREQNGKKEWSQMHMNRNAGSVEIMKCQKDELGMPGGCVE